MTALSARADDHVDDDALENRTPDQLAFLQRNIDEVIETTAFYAAFGVLLALLALAAVLQRQFAWGAYAGLTLLALLWNVFFEQNLGGMYWSGLALSPAMVVAFGFGLAILSAGVAAALAPKRLRLPLLAAAVAVIPIWIAHGVLPAPVDTYVFSLTLILAAGLHLMPVSKVRAAVQSLNAKWYLLAAAVAVFVWAVAVVAELTDEYDPIFLNRAFVGLLTSAFVILFLVRTVQTMRDRDRAIRKSLADARKEAETSRALFETEKRYSQAQALAQERARRLATASHDIRQPLTALRATMASIMTAEAPQTRAQMNAAFDYLRQLADEYIAEGQAEEGAPLARSERLAPQEHLTATLLGATLDRMFRKTAEDKDLSFEVALDEATLASDPLKLMRAVSNLTANAIAHTATGFVRVSGQVEGEGYRLSVRNSAPMEGDVDALMAPFAKGAASEGAGLGLSIVRDMAASGAFDVTLQTEVPGETTVTLQASIL